MYIYHLQMTMFLHFAWEHVAELQVQDRHAQQLTGTQLSTQRLFPPRKLHEYWYRILKRYGVSTFCALPLVHFAQPITVELLKPGF